MLLHAWPLGRGRALYAKGIAGAGIECLQARTSCAELHQWSSAIQRWVSLRVSIVHHTGADRPFCDAHHGIAFRFKACVFCWVHAPSSLHACMAAVEPHACMSCPAECLLLVSACGKQDAGLLASEPTHDDMSDVHKIYWLMTHTCCRC